MKKGILLFKRLNFILLMMFLCQSQFSFAQDNQTPKSVSGKITDDKGISIPGVNITLDESAIGTNSDVEGNFTIQIPTYIKNPTLTFTFIGFI